MNRFRITASNRTEPQPSGSGRNGARFPVFSGVLGSNVTWVIAVVVSTIWGTLFTACRHWVDPFTDELAGRPPVTTSSVQAIRTASVEGDLRHRPYEVVKTGAAGGTVTHGPLFFRDPLESTAADDGTFAWKTTDFAYYLYGPARFLICTAMFPVSTLVTPPWLLMASDGGGTGPVRAADVEHRDVPPVGDATSGE